MKEKNKLSLKEQLRRALIKHAKNELDKGKNLHVDPDWECHRSSKEMHKTAQEYAIFGTVGVNSVCLSDAGNDDDQLI